MVLAMVLGAAALSVASGPLEDLVEVSFDGQAVELWTSDGALVRLEVLGDDLLRIQAGPDGVLTDEGSGEATIVLPFEPPEVAVELREESVGRTLVAPGFEVRITPAPLRLELRRRPDGALLWRELKPLDFGEGGTTQTLSSSPDERFFGGGQQNGAFEFKGERLEISYSGGWEEGDRPSPAPMYLSSRGYGVLRNTWAPGSYDFRSEGHLTTTHEESRFDAYVFVAKDLHGLLERYTMLTGRAPLLPRWALGYGDADCYNDGDNAAKPGTVPSGWSDGPTGATPDVVESVAARYREHDMPGAWILPNDGYGCGYSELPEVVRRLAELGFRTGLWTEDGVERIAWEVGEAGNRVQKLDVAWTGQGGTFAMDANHAAARGFLEHSDARPFLWTVMGWAGIQRYAVTWTGDQSGSWDYIRWHVPTLIGSGLSGMAYSTGDVDGIFGGAPETFTRDLQWKCFTPVLMGMSGWSRAERKHPWWFPEPYRSANRRILKLRQRLTPYLYTLARETERTGAPMVRGLMWDHPDDPHAFSEDYPTQLFLGRDLLIAPVFRSQAASGGWRDGVHLPEGRWVDLFDGAVLDAGPAGRDVDVPVTLDTLPVLVRAGAILPLYPESLWDGQLPPDPLTLELYPHGPSTFVLYEDDGETREHRAGAFTEQRFSVDAPRDGSGPVVVALEPVRGRFDGMLEGRRFELVVHLHGRPAAVILDGVPLPERADATVVPGWTFDPTDRRGTTTVRTGELASRARHVVELTGFAPPPTPGGYPERPPVEPVVPADALTVVGRPAEEPGHPLENAFDGDPDTWFRTIRDQRLAAGPHELTLALGGRRLVEGLRIAPRNDRHWRYGQVRGYEVFLADVNGQWGEPVATGILEQAEGVQVVRFAPRAGRLLRLRVLSTHDDGADPMVLGASAAAAGAYDALAPVRVAPVTISELALLEHRPAGRPTLRQNLAPPGEGVSIDDLPFDRALSFEGSGCAELVLEGDWTRFRADAGLDDASAGTARFQLWGDGRLLWDSGPVAAGTIVKPILDVRGLERVQLRTVAVEGEPLGHWADPRLEGYQGAQVALRACGVETGDRGSDRDSEQRQGQ